MYLNTSEGILSIFFTVRVGPTVRADRSCLLVFDLLPGVSSWDLCATVGLLPLEVVDCWVKPDSIEMRDGFVRLPRSFA